MLKYIIFDVDGTLIDTEVAVLSSLQKMMSEEFGIQQPLSFYEFSLGIPGIAALEKLEVPKEKWLKILTIWDDHFKTFIDTVRVFPQIESCLEELKNLNLKVGIITSKTKEELTHDASYFPVLNHFYLIVTADQTLLHKPNPEPMLVFLQASGIKEEEAIYIGDTIYDYQCAASAKVRFALAKWGAKTQVGMKDHLVFEQPLDLIAWVKKQNNVSII